MDDIFSKELYFLIPFYPFTFERKFDIIEEDEEQIELLRQDYTNIAVKLEDLVKAGKMSELTKVSIMEMTRKVTEQLALKYEKVMKGVNEVVGGKILSYPAKEIAIENWKKGLLAGRQEGRQEGRLEATMYCYINAVTRGMPHEDAMIISGISEKDAARALQLRKEGKL